MPKKRVSRHAGAQYLSIINLSIIEKNVIEKR
jgi:hypothetical protein